MKVAIFTLLVLAAVSISVSGQAGRSTNHDGAKAMILEKDEGELRVRRQPLGVGNVPLGMPTSQFILKISPKNNGSQHLVMGTEQIPPGGRIRTHRHLEQDEILIIQTGEARVHLGDREADVHAGSTVFIPANTAIGLQNTGAEPISLVFIFSAPGFEDYMRCTSVPAGTQAPPVGVEEMRKCAHEGHVIYDDIESTRGKE